MATPTSESELPIPFPSVQEPSDSTGGRSPQSSVAGSSNMTSSDKLTALPLSSSRPATRPRNDSQLTAARLSGSSSMTRPSHFGITAAQRGYRRSLDASTSLPSFPIPESDAWLRSPPMRNAASEHSSLGKETPRQRASEYDIHAPRTHHHHHQAPHLVQAAISRLSNSRGGNEPSMSSPAKRPSPLHKSPESEPMPSKELPSTTPQPQSRAVSPLRIFQQWSSGHHHHPRGRQQRSEEPFIPINPFKRKGGRRFRRHKASGTGTSSLPSTATNGSLGSGAYGCDDALDDSAMTIRAFFQDLRLTLTDSIPRQLYLNFLLRLPVMYFTRVSRIFQEAEVSKPDIEKMIEVWCRQPAMTDEVDGAERGEEGLLDGRYHQGYNLPTRTASVSYPPGLSPPRGQDYESSMPRHGALDSLPFPDDWTPTSVSPALYRFKLSWEAFIDSVLREWKTFNIISALLSSAIVSMFQVPEAAEDPVTRTAALISLMCALMSLVYGCMYIVRFGTMRSMASASNWADDAQRTTTVIWWNVWVLLAMPAVWMAWAMVFFITAILSFVWRTGSSSDPDPGSRPKIPFRSALGPRIAITSVFLLGILYLFLIISTLKRYGASRGSATEAFLRAGSPGNDANRRPTSIAIGDVGGSLAAMGIPTLTSAGGKESGAGGGMGAESVVSKGSGRPQDPERGRGRERYRSPLGQLHQDRRRDILDQDSGLGLVDMGTLKPLTKINSRDSI